MSLEINKIAAAGLTAGVVAMSAGFVADLLFHREPLHENAFPIEVAGSEAPAGEAAPTAPESVLPLLADADPAAGEKLTRACQACHSFDQGGPNKVGPNLYGVVSGPVAHLDGFAYSDALKQKHEAGDTWTYENLDHFLAAPREWAPGTKMTYGGMKKVDDRANLIAYLRQQSDNPPPLPTAEEVQAVAPQDQGEAAAPAAGSESAEGGEQQSAGTQEAAEGGGLDIKGMIASADPAAGEKVARKCAACHSFDQGGPNKVGPNLYGIIGAPFAHKEDFTYSSAFQQRHEAGDTWTYDKLWGFLHDPRGHVPGTKMTFAGLKKDEEVAAVISYLRQQSDNPPPVE